ncbi:hypothetical protein K438DRAFT_1845601 [Mycena galopus ATCC 62051]|nr:hypothetical protein K438DRAFT_2029974 [Mycena galopus ATCC 62051]KAF8177585.1 hypothetical protein K438DRAFT_1845601 [Mycena galopus ATCC 62051]
MASISDLPQELVEKVVCEFKGDEANLRTCCLISPAFVHCSRQHLFSGVRLTAGNFYAFRILVESSPAVASYVRRLNIPLMPSFKLPMSAIVPPATLAKLPNVTELWSHSDPFDFRHLSAAEKRILAETMSGLTVVEIFLDRLWPLPAWAALLNGCSLLTTLTLSGTSTGWGTWSPADVSFPMPATETFRLHTLRVFDDCKILVPLSAWLIQGGALEALHTLVLDVRYLAADYAAPDLRGGLVHAAAASLRELTLNLDPPMALALAGDADSIHGQLTIASLPRLRALHLCDGVDLNASLTWLATFVQSPRGSALEELSLNHTLFRSDFLEISAETWGAIEYALLGVVGLGVDEHRTPHPHLRTVTLSGYQNFASLAPDAYEHFSRTVQERLPRLHERGLLMVGK